VVDSDLAVIVEATVAAVVVVDVVAAAASPRYARAASEDMGSIDNWHRRRNGSPSPSSAVS
jgi:hypothetical protein